MKERVEFSGREEVLNDVLGHVVVNLDESYPARTEAAERVGETLRAGPREPRHGIWLRLWVANPKLRVGPERVDTLEPAPFNGVWVGALRDSNPAQLRKVKPTLESAVRVLAPGDHDPVNEVVELAL